MREILFNLLIYPIVLILEFAFTLIYEMIGSAGFSILAVSIVVSFMVLPMYMQSDALQEKERREQEKMSRWVKHIRNTFKGDERFMILQEYYRQNHYHPLYVLRGSFSMLLEIPFFIAAYYFLSHLDLLHGTSFHMIRDLGAPDALISIGGVSLNLLPILMTAINFISGAIYTKGYPVKQKLQLYGLAILFLVLLYSSPSGLVLYWTMNNVFSLAKNIFVRISRKPERDLPVLMAAAGILFIIYMFVRGKLYSREIIIFSAAVCLICALPLVLYLVHHRHSLRAANLPKRSVLPEENTNISRIYLAGTCILAVLLGFVAPGSMVSADPADFVNVSHFIHPLRQLATPFCVYVGLFVIWFSVIYFLSDADRRKLIARVISFISLAAVINFMVFSIKDTLNLDFVFDHFSGIYRSAVIINSFVLLLLLLACILLWKFKPVYLKRILYVTLAALVGLSAYFIVITQQKVSKMSIDTAASSSDEGREHTVSLSRNGKNVVVIMLDRAVSGYLPYIMKEKPELIKAYSGFTYYPNCISFGEHTNFGAPALFGGYEYTPKAINEEQNKTIAQMHDEAISLMPILFSDAGGRATVCNIPYAGYQEISDYSVFDGYDRINAYNVSDEYVSAEYAEMISTLRSYNKHSFVSYSILQTLPDVMKKWFYDWGRYRGVRRFSDSLTGESIIRDYSILHSLPDICKIDDSEELSLFMMDNNTTHDPTILQLPDYKISPYVDNSDYIDAWLSQFDDRISMDEEIADKGRRRDHYHVNVLALTELGKWFDWMREQGIYDNTRIIIVADHGHFLKQFPDLIWSDDLDIQSVNPLLMVKDFNSTGFSTSDSFMTNADVPSLALEGIMDNAVNPYTGKPINQEAKHSLQYVTTSHNNRINNGDEYAFDTSDGKWYTVHTDIFNHDNWEEVK